MTIKPSILYGGAALVGLSLGLYLGLFLWFQNDVAPVTAALNMDANAYGVFTDTKLDTEQVEYDAGAQLSETESVTNEDLPESVALDVPFTPQAPFADWSEPYEEACEEASLLMVYNFWQGKTFTPQNADTQINDMVDWEVVNFGTYADTNADQTSKIATDYLGYDAEVITNPTTSDIKAALAEGSPIIVPAAGRALGNPNFTPPGPWYHMLVITGYENGEFITNDPGTRNGEGYRYDEDVLMSAMHDFPGTKEAIETGDPAILIVTPQ